MTMPICAAVSQCIPRILKMDTPLCPRVNQRAHALREITLIKAILSKQVGQRLHYFRAKKNCKQDKWPPVGTVLSSKLTSHTGDKDTVLIAAWTSILSSLCGDTSEAPWHQVSHPNFLRYWQPNSRSGILAIGYWPCLCACMSLCMCVHACVHVQCVFEGIVHIYFKNCTYFK